MSEYERAVVNYLLAQGWKRMGVGSVGELWGHGDALTAVPKNLEAGSTAWERLLLGVARAEQMPVTDVTNSIDYYMELQGSAPKVRPRSGSSGRVELDVHLDGPTVRNHETGAYDFGQYVMRSAEAVKELVKSARGARRQSRSLLVAGGPMAGSVRVVLREPDRSEPHSLLPGAPETVEGQALVLLSAIFGTANRLGNDQDTSVLRSHLAPLHLPARHALARLAETQMHAGWMMNGVIRRGSEESEFSMGLIEARTVSEVAREALHQTATETVSGTLDGWVWSSSQLSLITDDRRVIRVSVPMPLQTVVAELNAERDTRVVTRLNVYRRVASGTRDSVRTEYSLGSITRELELQTLT